MISVAFQVVLLTAKVGTQDVRCNVSTLLCKPLRNALGS